MKVGKAGKIAVFGVPSAAGDGKAGTERAPWALREVGLLAGLRALGKPDHAASDGAGSAGCLRASVR